jgi:nucleoside-diphosphate-sugar epimerase
MNENFLKIINEDLSFIADSDLPWEELEGKNILITGANGALPAYMVETILFLNKNKFAKKATIFALVREKVKAEKRFKHHFGNANLKFIFQDVCDKINLPEKIDIIIHAASIASPKYYGQNPVGTLLPNVLGTYNLLGLAREKNVESFLFFSAGAVYGKIQNDSQLTDENTFGSINPLAIESCYPESKKMGENMCYAWLKQYEIQTKIVRPFHTYGPGISLNDGRVFSDFVKNILNNENIIMTSDGSARRPFCYLADATLGFFTVLLKGEVGEAYNVAADEEISIKELAETLIKLFPEKNLKAIFKENSDKNYVQTKISSYSPDTTKIKKLGWKTNYSIEEGFKRMTESYQ